MSAALLPPRRPVWSVLLRNAMFDWPSVSVFAESPPPSPSIGPSPPTGSNRHLPHAVIAHENTTAKATDIRSIARPRLSRATDELLHGSRARTFVAVGPIFHSRG